MSDTTLLEKSMRSVFVGNIPYEVTEERMKIIFSDAGPVVSFKLVIDRDTGKSKGYGFCEYRDKETAQSAMRNLNNYEMGGRNLRVDIAGTERSRMEMANIQAQQQKERIYGEECRPEETERIIIERLATLTPEQMLKIVHEAKIMLDHNPHELTEMLEMNPQLSYALLHIGYAMNCYDKGTALATLYTPREKSTPFSNATEMATSDSLTVPVVAGTSSTTTMSGEATPSTSWMPVPPYLPPPMYYPLPEFTNSLRNYTDASVLPLPNSSVINEQEKSKLIMQVLHLTNEQIASLAPEQRQSIILLRNQIMEAKYNP